jgi:hypothetical protein
LKLTVKVSEAAPRVIVAVIEASACPEAGMVRRPVVAFT